VHWGSIVSRSVRVLILFCSSLFAAEPAFAQSAAVDYRVASHWGTGFVAEIGIRNAGTTPIAGWTIEFDLDGQLVGLWNGQVATAGSHYTVRDLGWNAALAPGGSAVIGFQIAYSGAQPAPTNCRFNGQTCAFGGEPTPSQPPAPPTVPPVVSITSPAEGATLSGASPIAAEVSVPNELRVTRLCFFADGNLIACDSAQPYSAAWDTSAVAAGDHTIQALAIFAGGALGRRSEPVRVAVASPPRDAAAGFFSMSGATMVDADGDPVRLTGVNWFGFETASRVVHGLWSRDYRSMLHQVSDLGFNAVRIPWSNAILEPGSAPNGITFSGADPYDGRAPMNAPLQGRTSLEVLDLVIAEAGRLGLRVILDNHSRKPDNFSAEGLWYSSDFPESRWIEGWTTMAARYRGSPNVVGFDLHNEPHDPATWGGDRATDYASAAERAAAAIHAVHPDVIVIVGGVQTYRGISYWWGGNLRGVRDRPLNIDPGKLLYSAHDYGPEVFPQTWFSAPDYPNNLIALWDQTWGFVPKQGLGGVFIGEFGIGHRESAGGRALVWIETLMSYMGRTSSWTYWSLNPNSGDTGGILQDDWVSVQQWKLDLLTPYLAAQFTPRP